ncbi:MAG: PEGA domain-containing protein, partial [Bradymonadaceae bacterium]
VARPTPAPPTSSVKQKDAPADGLGRITVYSRPRGNVFIGGDDKGQATPGTIEVESGRHDVQVRYEDGEMSEKKVVRVREGSRIKLFFRQ